MGVAIETADAIIRQAIERKRVIELVYFDKKRIVEPHDYGIHKGIVKLLAFQIGGASSGRLPNWRWLDVERMTDIRMLDRTFRGGRGTVGQQHHDWDQAFARVQPPSST